MVPSHKDDLQERPFRIAQSTIPDEDKGGGNAMMYGPVLVRRCDPARSPHGVALPSRLRLLAIAALALVLGLNDALAQVINNPAGGNVSLPDTQFPTGIFNSTNSSGNGGAIIN